MDQTERRQGPDWLIKILWAFTILAWLIFVFSLISYEIAKPEKIPGYAQYIEITNEYRTEWIKNWADVLFYQLIGSSILSLCALFANTQRLKRKTDAMHFNLVLLFIVCVSAGFYIWFEILPKAA